MNSREKMLIGMNEIILHCNNEEAMMPWFLNGVPDGADEEEIMEMANNEDTFDYCASLFLSIVKSPWVWVDGLYVNKTLITHCSRFDAD